MFVKAVSVIGEVECLEKILCFFSRNMSVCKRRVCKIENARSGENPLFFLVTFVLVKAGSVRCKEEKIPCFFRNLCFCKSCVCMIKCNVK